MGVEASQNVPNVMRTMQNLRFWSQTRHFLRKRCVFGTKIDASANTFARDLRREDEELGNTVRLPFDMVLGGLHDGAIFFAIGAPRKIGTVWSTFGCVALRHPRFWSQKRHFLRKRCVFGTKIDASANTFARDLRREDEELGNTVRLPFDMVLGGLHDGAIFFAIGAPRKIGTVWSTFGCVALRHPRFWSQKRHFLRKRCVFGTKIDASANTFPRNLRREDEE